MLALRLETQLDKGWGSALDKRLDSKLDKALGLESEFLWANQ